MVKETNRIREGEKRVRETGIRERDRRTDRELFYSEVNLIITILSYIRC